MAGASRRPFGARPASEVIASRRASSRSRRRGTRRDARETEDARDRLLGAARTLRLLGRTHWLLGRAELAVDSLECSIATSEKLGDAASADTSLADLVALHRAFGDVVAARTVLERLHPRVSWSDATHLPVSLQIQIVALALDEGDAGGRSLLKLALASTVEARDNHQRVLALDLVARMSTNGEDAIAAQAEADQLAQRMGLHATERPDRGDSSQAIRRTAVGRPVTP